VRRVKKKLEDHRRPPSRKDFVRERGGAQTLRLEDLQIILTSGIRKRGGMHEVQDEHARRMENQGEGHSHYLDWNIWPTVQKKNCTKKIEKIRHSRRGRINGRTSVEKGKTSYEGSNPSDPRRVGKLERGGNNS